jgi:carboxymethylenebutenolidase
MGGRHALVAAHHNARIAAAATLHGTHLVSGLDTSPHLLGAKASADIYAGFGIEDPFTPPEIIKQFNEAMAAKPSGAYACEVHAGAGHGYSLPDRDVYNAQATARDWTHILTMFEQRLSRS